MSEEKQETLEQKTTIDMPLELMQSILNYLTKRPYEEVYALVAAIMEKAKK